MPAQEDLVTSIDVKEAVQRAKEFDAKIFEPEKITRLGLEAVERSEDRKYRQKVLVGDARLFTAMVVSRGAAAFAAR